MRRNADSLVAGTSNDDQSWNWSAMTKLRTWMAILLLWMCLFLNIERVLKPINLASFVYVVVVLLAVAVISIPAVRVARVSRIIAAAMAMILFLKWTLGYSILGASLPLTITELTAMVITVAIAQQVTLSIAHFELGASELLMLSQRHAPNSFDEGQREMYREVNRARKFHRPLCVVVLEPTVNSFKICVHRTIEQLQRKTIQSYVNAMLAELLVQELNDCDVVTRSGNRFLIALTETTLDKAQDIVARIAASAQQKLGLTLKAGAAAFPDEEVTLAGLLERAEAGLSATDSEWSDLASSTHGASADDVHPEVVLKRV